MAESLHACLKASEKELLKKTPEEFAKLLESVVDTRRNHFATASLKPPASGSAFCHILWSQSMWDLPLIPVFSLETPAYNVANDREYDNYDKSKGPLTVVYASTERHIFHSTSACFCSHCVELSVTCTCQCLSRCLICCCSNLTFDCCQFTVSPFVPAHSYALNMTRLLASTAMRRAA